MSCSSCNNYTLVILYGNLCYDCSYFLPNCNTCTNSTICITCLNGFVMNSSICKNCSSAMPNCYLCTTLNICTQCINSTFLIINNLIIYAPFAQILYKIVINAVQLFNAQNASTIQTQCYSIIYAKHVCK